MYEYNGETPESCFMFKLVTKVRKDNKWSYIILVGYKLYSITETEFQKAAKIDG